MNSQNAFSFVESLWSRGMELVVHDEKLRVTPAGKLSDTDREYIRANRDKLIALVRGGHQLGHLPDGWQHDEAMSERVILVNRGALMDSCLFRTETGAKAFMSLLHTVPAAQAFRAACAIEDGTHDLPALVATLART